jgi:hypothetical protein
MAACLISFLPTMDGVCGLAGGSGIFAGAIQNDRSCHCGSKRKHTTGGIPRWSPTLVLVARFSAYVWQSGRDAQFSLTYGRMYPKSQHSIGNPKDKMRHL